MSTVSASRALEKVLYRYSAALGRGDFEAIAAIWKEAEDDPCLDHTTLEVTDVYALELTERWKSAARPSTSAKVRQYSSGIPWGTILALSVLAFVVVIAILTLLGPTIGNSFSNIVNSIGGSYYSTQSDEPSAPTPRPYPTVVPLGGYPQDHMIVKNGEIDLLVESTGKAIDQVTQIATDNGGYVLSSQSAMSGAARTASITIAVRSDCYETATRRLRQLAIEVLRELSTGEDVTSEYVDLESRLRNLEATRDRIKSFLDQAKTVREAMDINTQLSEIEGEIEQVKGRMTYLSGRSTFSTITVNIQQKIEATLTPTPTPTFTPTPTPRWSLGPTVDNAARTQVNLARGFLEVLTWVVIVLGPYLFTLALIVWLVRSITRHRSGR